MFQSIVFFKHLFYRDTMNEFLTVKKKNIIQYLLYLNNLNNFTLNDLLKFLIHHPDDFLGSSYVGGTLFSIVYKLLMLQL